MSQAIRGVHFCQPGDYCANASCNGGTDLKLLKVRDWVLLSHIWAAFPYTYKITDKVGVLSKVCRERKWFQLYDDEMEYYSSSITYNFWWYAAGGQMPPNKALNQWQILNQLPNAGNVCKKDNLVRYMKKMKKLHPSLYAFSPVAFNLPTEFTAFVKEHRRREEAGTYERIDPRTGKKTPAGLPISWEPEYPVILWIAKPVGKSQGKGIFIVDSASDMKYDDKYIVQEYIFRPFLINGYKWDLRLYVAIVSNDPLVFYAYREGIVRFATKPYDITRLGDMYRHLTNTSLNKKSPTYHKNKPVIGMYSKWKIAKLRTYLRKTKKIADYLLWQKIWSVLVLTIIGEGSNICKPDPERNTGFQFLGFDIVVDKNLDPHLCEININPGLGCSNFGTVDKEVKMPMLHELFDLLGLPDGRKFPEPSPTEAMDSSEFQGALLKAMQPSFVHRPSSANNSPTKSPKTAASTQRLARSRRAPVTPVLPGRDFNNNRVLTRHVPGSANRFNPTLKALNSWKESREGEPKIVPPPYNPVTTVQLPRLTHPSGPSPAATIHLPVGGPGMTFPSPNWRKPPMNSGNWVRIFPFDEYTQKRNAMRVLSEVRESILRVQSYLQSAQYVTNKGKMVRDELYDNILERELNTKPWHPPVEEEELPDEGEDPEGVYDFLYEDRLYPKGKPPTGRK